MNEYDSNRISNLAKEVGYIKTENVNNVDCYVLNTCHIREKATEKVYHDIGRLKKNYKNKKKPIVLVAGCVAQAENNEMLEREPYIDAVIGPQSYQNIPRILSKLKDRKNKFNFTDFDVVKKFDRLNAMRNLDSKISSFVTIQEGCDKFCNFCVVPYTRGAEFSRSPDEIFNEAKELVDNGAREIVLLGQNVNAYKYKDKKLSDLIKKISEINDLKRIRYTTSHPIDFSIDLIKAHKDVEKLMPMIHLPVQSGSNKILERMNRKHTIEDYLELINNLREINSKIQFSSDFIIGYPGETNKDFEDTLKLIKQIKFINSYSFIYSSRPGTPASKMENVKNNISKDRLVIFQKEAENIKNEFRKKLFNKISIVLFENKVGDKNEYFGRDEFSNSVIVESKTNLKGKIKEVKIIGGNHNKLYGEVYQKTEEKEFAA